MNDCHDFALCPFTCAHIGWRDSDDPPDGILDPIDHPSSDRSMVIGAEEPLALGDWVDIYGAGDDWVKRLVASDWSMDQGHVFWDGIRYDGLVTECGDYSWRRNGGTAHQGVLAEDTAAPTIADLVISLYTQPALLYALRFRFEDADTRSGRVRAVASPSFPGPPDIKIIPDDYLLDTQGVDPIMRGLPELVEGWWDMTVRVWDVGDGQWDSEEVPFYYGGSAVDETQILVPELTLSRGRPTPSASWVEWALQRDQDAEVDLKVVGADGRCVRSWPSRAVSAGVTRILWDGLDNRGSPVAAGRYYLVVSDGNRILSTRAAILVR